MKWERKLHLFIQGMSVCRPDDNTELTVHKVMGGWTHHGMHRGASFRGDVALSEESAKAWAEKAWRDKERAHLAAVRARVEEAFYNRRMRLLLGGQIYIHPKFEEEYPDIDLDRLWMCYEDAAIGVDGEEDIDIDEVVDDYMRGER